MGLRTTTRSGWRHCTLSVASGQFLLKDHGLLGAAVWTLGESLDSMYREHF